MMTSVKNELLVQQGAQVILKGFNAHQKGFMDISLKANDRFLKQDWRGAHHDVVERINLYGDVVDHIIDELAHYLGQYLNELAIWEAMKAKYALLIKAKTDFELAMTFFNSITRRIFQTVGVNPRLEFGDSDFEAPDEGAFPCPVCTTNVLQGDIKQLLIDALAGYQPEFTFDDLKRLAAKISLALHNHLDARAAIGTIEGIEMIETVFYRNKAAYVIGRIYLADGLIPIVLALLNGNQGTVLDAVLLTEAELSVLFSYTRSYFRVKVDSAYELTRFLKTLMPLKRLSELYTALGYHKHGKAELYREIQRHLMESSDLFTLARGKKGMVMIVFTLASFNVVFKVIKDHFDYPKNTTRQSVMKQYRLVFHHDRAGRLIDAQEFKDLKFLKARFDVNLLDELLESAPGTVRLEGEYVIFSHLYTERRVTPLDLYLKENGGEKAEKAVVDYGNAIKDLAATNIFPGDLFLKNFGVTRLGRVVFYDYDELCFLTECNFRKMPQSHGYDDELEASPWFMVGKDDVFPEEFRIFIGLPPHLLGVFEAQHADLFDTPFWTRMQNRLRQGEILDIFPYPQSLRIG